MRNALNSQRKDSFISVAHVRTPGLYSLLWQAYFSPTRLFFGDHKSSSETGIQQRNPIEPAIFALTVDKAPRRRLRAIRVEVNGSKRELIIINDSVPKTT